MQSSKGVDRGHPSLPYATGGDAFCANQRKGTAHCGAEAVGIAQSGTQLLCQRATCSHCQMPTQLTSQSPHTSAHSRRSGATSGVGTAPLPPRACSTWDIHTVQRALVHHCAPRFSLQLHSATGLADAGGRCVPFAAIGDQSGDGGACCRCESSGSCWQRAPTGMALPITPAPAWQHLLPPQGHAVPLLPCPTASPTQQHPAKASQCTWGCAATSWAGHRQASVQQ